MRMTIRTIEYTNESIYVTGNTDIGSIKGVWQYSELPIQNSSYFFELNLGELDRREISIIKEENACPCVSSDGRQVSFKGICEEVDDVYVIRFAPDWIEMLEVDNDDFTIRKGDTISFSTDSASIIIYPY